MPQPIFLGYGLAAVMVSVSTYCLGRLLVAKRWDRRNDYGVNISHVLMGLAMAGMLVPRWDPLSDRIWIVAFSVIAAWFAAMSVRFVGEHGLRGSDEGHAHHISHNLIHMTMACTMVYMYEVSARAGSSSTGAAMSGAVARVQPDYLGLSFVFIVTLLASAVWQIDALGKFSPRRMALIEARGGAEAPRRGDRPGGGAGDCWPAVASTAPRDRLPCLNVRRDGLHARTDALS